jgi:rhodanese-related sulfurtransferase
MKFNHVFQILTLVLFSSFAQANNSSIGPEKVLQLIQNKQAPLILDVRSAQEFAQGHIPGAINIAYQLLPDSPQLNAYKDQDIVIYCRSGRRAQIASQILQKKGFERLIDLRGSMIAWQKLNYPLALF